jgi:hypothetical protein
MKRPMTKGRHRIAFLVVACLLLFFVFFTIQKKQTLTIRHQITGEVYVTVFTHEGETLQFKWIHSFEHIPWNEYYTIGKDNRLFLDKFEVAGFGAGIPENEGTVSIENGMVVMKDLDSVFDDIHWINSQTALVSIALDNQILTRGSSLPQSEPIILTIKGTISICPRFPLKP